VKAITAECVYFFLSVMSVMFNPSLLSKLIMATAHLLMLSA
jgi:hypothetical protein